MANEKPQLARIFGGRDAETQNALWTALIECGKDYARQNNEQPTEKSCYGWLYDTTRTTIVVSLSDKLRELGFEIRAVN